MEFVLYCLDRPGRSHVRRLTRAAHLEYVAGRQGRFRFGGPLVDESGAVRGSLMIVRAESRAELEQHMRGDPFFNADLFESVTIWTTRQVLPETTAGALRAEIEQAKQATLQAV